MLNAIGTSCTAIPTTLHCLAGMAGMTGKHGGIVVYVPSTLVSGGCFSTRTGLSQQIQISEATSTRIE
eukprot:727841-Prorocentrum_lima.AAC.1